MYKILPVLWGGLRRVNGNVRCKILLARVIEEWKMSIQHWWIILTGENGSTQEKNLSHCYFIHHKSYMDWPGIKPRPPH